MVIRDEIVYIICIYITIKILNWHHGLFRFRIFANMLKSVQYGREVYEKITKVTDRFLDVVLDYVGHVPYDKYVIKFIRKQQAVVDAFPGSKAAMAYKTLAEKINKWPLPVAAGGHMEFFVERLIQGNSLDVEAMQ